MKARVRIALCLLALLGTARAQESAPPDIKPTVEKALGYITTKTMAWKEKYGCATCHHAPFMLWSNNAARARGYAVDEAAVTTIRDWLQNTDNFAGLLPAPTTPEEQAGGPVGFSFVMSALAAGPDEDVNLESLKRYAAHYAKSQKPDGSWAMGEQGRPPFFGAAPASTRFVRLAMAEFPELTGTDPLLPNTRAADAWLAAHTENLTHQERVFDLMIAVRTGRPKDVVDAMVAQLVAEQNSDGGWSQTREMQGDAWATGQSLYALALAGRRMGDAAVDKAIAYLIKFQTPEGYWRMASRPGHGAPEEMMRNTADPEPISVPAAGWAVIALLKATEE